MIGVREHRFSFVAKIWPRMQQIGFVWVRTLRVISVREHRFSFVAKIWPRMQQIGFVWVRFFCEPLFLGRERGKLGSFCIIKVCGTWWFIWVATHPTGRGANLRHGGACFIVWGELFLIWFSLPLFVFLLFFTPVGIIP